jgi:hypothetical protein
MYNVKELVAPVRAAEPNSLAASLCKIRMLDHVELKPKSFSDA